MQTVAGTCCVHKSGIGMVAGILVDEIMEMSCTADYKYVHPPPCIVSPTAAVHACSDPSAMSSESNSQLQALTHLALRFLEAVRALSRLE